MKMMMKKMLTPALILTVLTLASTMNVAAQTVITNLWSQNVVGFTPVTSQGRYTMLAANSQDVAWTNGVPASFLSLIKTANLRANNTTSSSVNADLLLVYFNGVAGSGGVDLNQTPWTFYHLYQASPPNGMKEWVADPTFEWDPIELDFVAKYGPLPSTNNLPRGFSFWLYRANTNDLLLDDQTVLMGQVSTNDFHILIEGPSGGATEAYNLIGNGALYPLDLNSNHVQQVSGSYYSATYGAGDEINIKNPDDSYIRYYYYQGKWVMRELQQVQPPPRPPQLVDVPAPSIPSGVGFWYIRRGTGGDLNLLIRANP
jgi:hypothetical protein